VVSYRVPMLESLALFLLVSRLNRAFDLRFSDEILPRNLAHSMAQTGGESTSKRSVVQSHYAPQTPLRYQRKSTFVQFSGVISGLLAVDCLELFDSQSPRGPTLRGGIALDGGGRWRTKSIPPSQSDRARDHPGLPMSEGIGHRSPRCATIRRRDLP